jgi:AraC-like DNA-binding protein
LATLNLVRTATLTGYVDVARSFGLDAHRQLKAAGLHRLDFSDVEAFIPAAAVAELLERSAAKTGAEDFGLRMAAKRSLAHLGPLGLIVREEPTVRNVIRSLERYSRLRTENLVLRFEEDEDVACLRLQLLLKTQGSVRQAVELAVGIVFRTIKELAGDAWTPDYVSFSHPSPVKKTIHTSFFGTKVLFDNDFDGIILPVRALEAPIPSANPVMARFIRQYLEIITQPTVTIEAAVRQLVFALLPSGRCSSETIARQLGIDRRTLSRRLEAGSTTFSLILNEVRAELVGRYIKTERRSLTETAQLLGFAELSSFSRWFQRKFGTSATTWQKAELVRRGRRLTQKRRLVVDRRPARAR